MIDLETLENKIDMLIDSVLAEVIYVDRAETGLKFPVYVGEDFLAYPERAGKLSTEPDGKPAFVCGGYLFYPLSFAEKYINLPKNLRLPKVPEQLELF